MKVTSATAAVVASSSNGVIRGLHVQIFNNWRASEASETLSGLFNRESWIYYIYIYIYI